MGIKRVYLAHDTLLDREVAFALIKTEGFDQTSKERISREAQAMGRLGVHPNIVAVLDLGQEDDGTPYMVTELMGGGDVEGLLEVTYGVAADRTPSPSGREPALGGDGEGVPPSAGPSRAPARGGASAHGGLPLERTIEIGKAVCEGLEFAHARGIVHRDLKPGNVWLTEDGTAKIGDFGLAVMTDRSRLTREGMMVGTVSYMPPEQATGGEITPKADLYSLGAMLYEMVAGRPPFLGDDEIAIIGQHINTPPVAPTWHNSTCPRPLEALVMRLLSKDPSERPDSAQDVFTALDAIDLTARGESVEQDATSLESLAGGVFVGRQQEMDQLKAALEEVLGGRGRLIALSGEPGIGKTRTAEELATYAGLRGARVMWGRCYETGGQPPYWPWVQAIRSYVREIDPDELRRQMGSSASVVAEIVTDVKERLPDVPPPPQLDDPDSARFRLFDSMTSFLKTASQTRPLVLILDDLHWSDGPSLTFLEFMAREIGQSRILVVGTYRDMELNRRHPLTVTLGDLSRERLFERVVLRGIGEADIARFIEIAAGFRAPSELSATVFRHTEGNPLFVTEVVRELVQSGELAENRASGDSTWSVRIPEGVREVIGRRLDRLSERANTVLTIAAVVGRDFRLDALKRLAEDATEGQLLDVLDEALAARIVEELSDEVGHYQFTHALMQETLTGELSLARRVRLHARIAETLERFYGTEANEHAAELAHHFGESESILGTERMVGYAIVSGEHALNTVTSVKVVF
ncbi:MAG: AAA family ATPase [Chloroflexi bacterium]|nr:AAA family ATPase [Chloroflexota bacterium]